MRASLLLDGAGLDEGHRRYLRGSATKARAVLDLIRGLDVAAPTRCCSSPTARGRRRPQGARQRRRQRRAQRQPGRRRTVRRRLLRRRGPDAQALPPACPWPRQPDPQAHLPHHRDRRPDQRRRLEVVQARHAAGPAGRRAGTSAQARRDRVARSRARAEGLRGGEGDAEALEDEVAKPADDAEASLSDETTEEVALADTDTVAGSESAEATDEVVQADTETDQVVTAQLASRRAGTQSTKTRSEVRGGGAKPYRQKGTGRARQGSTNAPHFSWRRRLPRPQAALVPPAHAEEDDPRRPALGAVRPGQRRQDRRRRLVGPRRSEDEGRRRSDRRPRRRGPGARRPRPRGHQRRPELPQPARRADHPHRRAQRLRRPLQRLHRVHHGEPRGSQLNSNREVASSDRFGPRPQHRRGHDRRRERQRAAGRERVSSEPATAGRQRVVERARRYAS